MKEDSVWICPIGQTQDCVTEYNWRSGGQEWICRCPCLRKKQLSYQQRPAVSECFMHIWLENGANVLLVGRRTQIGCPASSMQSPRGHTLYFVADLTHIICIYSRLVSPPSLSPCVFSFSLSGLTQKEANLQLCTSNE